MKYATVARIAWLVALGGVCLGQGGGENKLTVPLVVAVMGDKLEVTARLEPGKDWSNLAKGNAKVESGDPKLNLKPDVAYSISGDAAVKTLAAEIAYTQPATMKSTLKLSGIKNIRNEAVVFEGEVPFTPALPVDPDADAKKKGQQAGTSAQSFWSRIDWNNWLIYTDTAVLGFLLLSLSTYPLWGRRRAAQHYPGERDTFVSGSQQPVDLGPVSDNARIAVEKAIEAKKQADYAREDGNKIAGRLDAALEDLKALQGLDLRTLVSERKSDLQYLGRVLQDINLEPQPAVEQSSMAQSKREEAAAPAIVNRWLEKGGKDRKSLGDMAKQLGVQAQLMNHKDLNLVFQDLTTFEYPFEEDADGPWFWVEIEGSTEFWAVPADAVFFGMGRAPSLVERLFDGMQGVSQGFQFRAIYRACRLKPVAGRSGVYSVVSRGLLQLEGAAAPKVAHPPSFEELLPPRPAPSASGAQSAGRQLTGWVQSANQQLLKTQQDVRGLSSQLTALQQKLNAPSLTEEQVRRYVNQQVAGVMQKLKQLESELRERQAAPVPPPQYAAEVPRELSTPETSTALLPPATGPAEPDTSSTEALVRGGKETVGEMPEGWQEALRRAAALPTSEPELVEVPREELYVQRVRNLAAELQELDASRTVAVVHLMVGQQGNTFEVHETTGGTGHAQEPVMCLSCYTAHTWQLAVCVGARAAAELFVLYPLGGFNKSKYPSGYARLIANPPAANISGIEYPARLQRVAEAAPTYVVARKMQLTGNEAER